MRQNTTAAKRLTLNIGSRTIGPGHRTLVIAEIGVNHDGSLRRALELVELATACGADAVKLQVFSAINLMHGCSEFAGYQRRSVNEATPADMLRKYELSPADVRTLVKAIESKGLLPIATPFSPADVDVLAELRLPAVKIASPDLVNRLLLHRAARLGVPLIISTGAATMEEIERTQSWLNEWGVPFALLHCVSSYPTPAGDANLCWVGELAERFSAPIGFSDHTVDVICGALAVAGGACVIEKHLTYDRRARGPDHSASADPEQFAAYVKLIRQAEVLCGTPGKRVLEAEQDVRRVSRQSLVAVRELPVDHVIAEADLTVQRPGTGISAAEVMAVLGMRVTQAVEAGAMLSWGNLSRVADAA